MRFSPRTTPNKKTMSDWQEKALANEARANELEEKLQKLTKLIRQNQESMQLQLEDRCPYVHLENYLMLVCQKKKLRCG